MSNKEIILRAIEFIENNLTSDLRVIDCSNKVNYSLYHFIRLFHNITGFSPKSYIQQRRLSESVKDLIEGEKKVIEIAFSYQFSSHEAYSRAFKKYFGISPSEVKRGTPLSFFPILNPLQKEFFDKKNEENCNTPLIVLLPYKILAGISIFVPDTSRGDEISRLWQQFFEEVHFIEERLIPEKYYQIQFWSDLHELGGLYFFIGVELASCKKVPPQFVLKEIPEMHYLQFIHKGFSNQVGLTYKYIYNQYLPETNFVLDSPFNFEFYGDKYKGPFNQDSESEIYIPIKNYEN